MADLDKPPASKGEQHADAKHEALVKEWMGKSYFEYSKPTNFAKII